MVQFAYKRRKNAKGFREATQTVDSAELHKGRWTSSELWVCTETWWAGMEQWMSLSSGGTYRCPVEFSCKQKKKFTFTITHQNTLLSILEVEQIWLIDDELLPHGLKPALFTCKFTSSKTTFAGALLHSALTPRAGEWKSDQCTHSLDVRPHACAQNRAPFIDKPLHSNARGQKQLNYRSCLAVWQPIFFKT